MSSQDDDRTAQPNEDPAARNGHTPGALLRQERMRRGLSVQQAAEGLHLDPWIVEAIEANQFLALGAPVYCKGYLRKFAALLELAPDVVIARYEALSDTPVVPTPVPVITTPPPRPKWPKRLAWTLVVLLLAAIGWFVFDLLMPPPMPSVPQAEPAATSGQTVPPALAPIAAPEISATRSAASEAPPVAAPIAASESAGPPDRSPMDRSPSAAGAGARELPSAVSVGAQEGPPASRRDERSIPATVPVSETQPVVVASNSDTATRLSLEFSEASWVEVYDANGQRLLYDVGQPGRVRAVAGPAPLSVVIGMASAVTAQVNDRKIVVPRRANKDSTRFVVGSDGSVQ